MKQEERGRGKVAAERKRESKRGRRKREKMRGERNYSEGQDGTRESGCRSPVENQAAERKDRTKLARE